jgi:hypothetical protein
VRLGRRSKDPGGMEKAPDVMEVSLGPMRTNLRRGQSHDR